MGSLDDILLNILFVLEGIAFIVSLAFFRKLRQQGLLFITIFMLTVVVAETVGRLTQLGYITSIKNVPWYNTLLPLQSLSLLLLFHANTGSPNWRWVIRIFGAVIIALYIGYFAGEKSPAFDAWSYVINEALVAACCLYYLYECMNSAEIASIHKSMLLYISLGVLLFHLGTLPFNSLRSYLYNHYENIFYTYFYVEFVLNYAMYSLISFGIIWGKKK